VSVLFVMMRTAGQPEVNGGERSTIRTAQALREIGHPVRFLVTAEDELGIELRAAGFPVDLVDVGNPFHGIRGAAWSRLPRLVRLAAGIARISRRHRIQIVHTSGVPGALGAWLGARLAGAGLVNHIRDLSRHGRTRWVEEIAILLADRSITVGDSLRRRLIETAHAPLRGAVERRLTTVYNAFPLSELRRIDRGGARARLGIPASAFLAVIVASVEPRKRQRELIAEVVPRVAEAIPEASFVFVGGAKDEAYAAACRQAGGPIRFTGQLAADDVFDWYGAADVLVIASRSEGLPRVGVEAQAAGVPIVSVRIPGPTEVVLDGETGVLVDPDDFGALAEALIDLGRDPAKRQAMARAAATSDWSRFSADRHRAAIVSVYGDLLRR
jgi:L-malate glycosyltransferase